MNSVEIKVVEEIKKKIVREGTTSRERKNKTHLKVIGEKTKKIHSKVTKGSVVKAHAQMIKKYISNILTKKEFN